MKISCRVTPLLLAVGVSGCAFSAVRRPEINRYFDQFSRTQTFSISVGDAVMASKSSAEAMGYEILTVNSDLGLVRTKVRPVTIPDVCDCGTWNRVAINGTAESTLVVNSRPEGDNRASVSIDVQCITNFSGQNLYGATTRRETYPCASRGVIENEFWSTLGRVLKAKAK